MDYVASFNELDKLNVLKKHVETQLTATDFLIFQLPPVF
jgi:hypothetical protein